MMRLIHLRLPTLGRINTGFWWCLWVMHMESFFFSKGISSKCVIMINWLNIYLIRNLLVPIIYFYIIMWTMSLHILLCIYSDTNAIEEINFFLHTQDTEINANVTFIVKIYLYKNGNNIVKHWTRISAFLPLYELWHWTIADFFFV